MNIQNLTIQLRIWGIRGIAKTAVRITIAHVRSMSRFEYRSACLSPKLRNS
jgi:hypothetical protein